MEYKNLPLKEKMNLYTQAKKLREEKGWGQVKIGRELDLPESTVARWIFCGEKPDGRRNYFNSEPTEELVYLIGSYTAMVQFP